MRSALWVSAAMMMAAPAAAQLAGEHLAVPADPAMHLGFAQSRPVPMQEYIGPNETVDDWTRMVTVQQLGYRAGLTPRSFLSGWGNLMARACPGAIVGVIADLLVAGHTAADLRVDCPRNPQTGKPETAFARTILGNESLHMIQAATRRVPTSADLSWAQHVLGGAQFCSPASTDKQCIATVAPPLGSSAQ